MFVAILNEKVSDKKRTEILSFLQTRFDALETLRGQLDDDIRDDLAFYNGEDPLLSEEFAD